MLPPLLADACISSPVVEWLRAQGLDIASVRERGLGRLDDRAVLAIGLHEQRFVLTHDSDFGQLVLAEGQPVHGILYLRPGGRPSRDVIAELAGLLVTDVDWRPPLIAVFRRGRLRLRYL